MKASEYEEIRTLLLQNDTNPNIFTFVQDRFSSIPLDTFIAISSQEKSRRLRSDYPKLTKPHLVRQYVARYTAGEDVLTISRDSGLPPCLLCRFLFENLLGLNKQQITQCLKDPLSLRGFETNLNSKDNVSITVTKFIQDAEKCVESDQVASPRVEMIRRVTGLEYVNRFGSGLVIYWFGFVDELNDHPDVLLLDHFPNDEEIYCLPRLNVSPRP